MKLGFAIPHEIKIRASANMGFIVEIGCGEFVAESYGMVLDGLRDYLENPKGWEEKYEKMPSRGPICEDIQEQPSRQRGDEAASQ